MFKNSPVLLSLTARVNSFTWSGQQHTAVFFRKVRNKRYEQQETGRKITQFHYPGVAHKSQSSGVAKQNSVINWSASKSFPTLTHSSEYFSRGPPAPRAAAISSSGERAKVSRNALELVHSSAAFKTSLSRKFWMLNSPNWAMEKASSDGVQESEGVLAVLMGVRRPMLWGLRRTDGEETSEAHDELSLLPRRRLLRVMFVAAPE
eukprot:comp19233_c0_seq1/m.22003 comp19233_c0_seq1/g.22003  ORF comp19233_c0_seq1/g.22003 comp19233_c0_seq1/m.22003 type:complete len:205 (+) comp19233_c0_seq1:240-854(+)